MITMMMMIIIMVKMMYMMMSAEMAMHIRKLVCHTSKKSVIFERKTLTSTFGHAFWSSQMYFLREDFIRQLGVFAYRERNVTLSTAKTLVQSRIIRLILICWTLTGSLTASYKYRYSNSIRSQSWIRVNVYVQGFKHGYASTCIVSIIIKLTTNNALLRYYYEDSYYFKYYYKYYDCGNHNEYSYETDYI